MIDDEILNGIIEAEGPDGEVTNDPMDAGGWTRWGITLDVLSSYRGRVCAPKDIQTLTREGAKTIYRVRYIRPFDGLDERVRVNVIDMGVNAGQDRATKLLQQLIGVHVDGTLGPATRRASAAKDYNEAYVIMRIAFYEALIEKKPTQIKWRNGWRNRALQFSHLERRLRGAQSLPVERTGKAYA
jgi:lysozyme family protein